MCEKFELTRHLVKGASTGNKILVTDKPNRANANHSYTISGFNTATNDSQTLFEPAVSEIELLFQNGPIPEKGKNGVTMEDLLAICLHRLRGFQTGPFLCEENQTAFEHIELALAALNQRTEKRIQQNVEGKELHHE